MKEMEDSIGKSTKAMKTNLGGFGPKKTKKMNEEIGATEDAIDRYMYNFWDTTFRLDTGEWKGEDLSFCALAREEGFRIYANLDSGTTHHGSWGWKGRFGDFLVKKD